MLKFLQRYRYVVSLSNYVGFFGIWCAFLCWMPTDGDAKIYKYVENGIVHYTNRPPMQKTYELFRNNPSPIFKKDQTDNSGKIGTTTPTPYLDIIHKLAAAYDLSPDLIKAIVKVESNYNHRAVSPKGAQGLMQLMPGTAERFGVADVFDPEENITGGVKFLRFLFDEFGENNIDLVLAGYNAGEQAVHNSGDQVPPYHETKHYIEKVKALYQHPNIAYKVTASGQIYRYLGANGILIFTNIPKTH